MLPITLQDSLNIEAAKAKRERGGNNGEIQFLKKRSDSVLPPKTIDEMIAELDQEGQIHINTQLAGFDEKHAVFKQLSSIDWKASIGHYSAAKKISTKHDDFVAVSKVFDFRDENKSQLKKSMEAIGLENIYAGKVGAVIMSGGQGTRLGCHGPKGEFEIGAISKNTIFQYHIERLIKIKQNSIDHHNATHPTSQSLSAENVHIPIYIMTSDLNHKIIKDFFRQNSFFQYPSDDIVFFEQGLEPAFTLDGKIILESPEKLSLSPDGNGGIYKAMQKDCIQDMQLRGIEYLHIYGIDNVLTKSLDPLFIGTCIHEQVEIGNKVVWRASSAEKVGVTAELHGKMHILEYSEIPKNYCDLVDSTTGKLVFGAANICNHFLSIDFLVNKVFQNLSASYHFAEKMIPFYDYEFECDKSREKREKIKGVKLEMFIFDVFPLAEKWLVLETDREDEFAPVKNANVNDNGENNADSPDTARAMISKQGIKWLLRAGATVQYRDDNKKLVQITLDSINTLSITNAIHCEISPLVSYSGENLESFAGQTVTLPFQLTPTETTGGAVQKVN